MQVQQLENRLVALEADLKAANNRAKDASAKVMPFTSSGHMVVVIMPCYQPACLLHCILKHTCCIVQVKQVENDKLELQGKMLDEQTKNTNMGKRLQALEADLKAANNSAKEASAKVMPFTSSGHMVVVIMPCYQPACPLTLHLNTPVALCRSSKWRMTNWSCKENCWTCMPRIPT